MTARCRAHAASADTTVAEVRKALSEFAYTTVLTILRNLETKGYVRHEEEGRASAPKPVRTQGTTLRS